jgi:hypothetical protein
MARSEIASQAGEESRPENNRYIQENDEIKQKYDAAIHVIALLKKQLERENDENRLLKERLAMYESAPQNAVEKLRAKFHSAKHTKFISDRQLVDRFCDANGHPRFGKTKADLVNLANMTSTAFAETKKLYPEIILYMILSAGKHMG